MIETNEIDIILRCFEKNIKPIDIAFILNIPVSRVYYVKQKNKAFPLEMPKVVAKKTIWCGRLPTIAKRIRTNNPNWTIREVRLQVLDEIGASQRVPSESEFYRFFSENGFVFKTLKWKPLLTDKHKHDRLMFAQEHLAWTSDDWDRVWWSDETTVVAIPQKKKYQIWTLETMESSDLPTAPAVQGGGFKVMFWGAISKSGLGHLVPIRDTLTAKKYMELLEESFFDMYYDSGDRAIFMQDGAGCHTAARVLTYLRENRIKTMKWPARSPDLNPIENIWALLKGKLRKISGFPGNREELIARAQSCWRELGQEAVDNILNSMPKRMRLVVEQKGGPIKY